MPTIQDVAGDLGLSAMTVSRALNGHPDVKEETRLRVLSRARELNYRPNRWARSLVTQRSNIVGVVIPSVSHTFFTEIFGGIQTELEEQGFTLMLCNSSGDPEREQSAIDMLVGSRAEGLIVASSYRHTDPSLFEGLRDEGVPFVLIDRRFDEFAAPSVRADDIAVGRLAARHLMGLGHRRIAHIKGDAFSTAEGRRKGFVDTATAAGLDVPDDHIVEGGFGVEEGMRGMRRLLELDQRPTAVFAPSDLTAMGAISVCREAGLRVPEDISIMGAGSIEHDYLPDPFITSLRWDRHALGEDAGRMLAKLIAGEELTYKSSVKQPTLVPRRSTAAI